MPSTGTACALPKSPGLAGTMRSLPMGWRHHLWLPGTTAVPPFSRLKSVSQYVLWHTTDCCVSGDAIGLSVCSLKVVSFGPFIQQAMVDSTAL